MDVDVKLPGVIFLVGKHCLRFCPKRFFFLFFLQKVLSNNAV